MYIIFLIFFAATRLHFTDIFFMSSPSSVHLIIFMIRVDDAHLSHLALKSEMMCKHQLFCEPALILQEEARGWVNRES